MKNIKIVAGKAFLLFLFCFSVSISEAKPVEECKKMVLHSGHELSYCVKDLGFNPKPTHIVYFFHGVGGSANSIFSMMSPKSDLYEAMTSRGLAQAPVFVGLSFGRQALVPREPRGETPASLEALLTQAFPAIEAAMPYEFKTHPPVRHMMGLSLGGFNALNVSALRPEAFRSVIALCPALLNFDPFQKTEVEAYLARHQGVIRRTKVEFMILMLRREFQDFASWNKRNPIELVKKGSYQTLPLFLSTGLQDEYGFMEGAAVFTQAAYGKVASGSVFAPIDGDHCFFDGAALKVFVEEHLN